MPKFMRLYSYLSDDVGPMESSRDQSDINLSWTYALEGWSSWDYDDKIWGSPRGMIAAVLK